ncbi:MBL fold metallo-hydrolase [Pisciglobus halotolerans]|uniref:Phosphoribosyl 1,2-cyclic phosphodiesterase n=1 Tax=Pisciglobus halotolerans TaxID=745365 RepID=A0A1I3BQB9_9LACT|nr:MBL fold metallo-hydrolase [Pisciglobus halotolerans]SFH64508.1 Phosphoribosyl 1,2-cyclic phosphodiesterase [Pisciglobus halotolerans]
MEELQRGLNISILASGSSGNVTYIESAKQRILVDCGLSGKKVTALMNQIGRDPADLDGILVTHEHRDHVHGVGVLARKYKLDVYANEKTWQAMDHIVGNIAVEQKHIFEMGKTMAIGDIDVESFGVSHDAVAPQFYNFHKDGKSFVILTDTGYVSDRMRGIVTNADAYLFESNHDLEMLRMGRYPWSLKQRILGDKGHLSNEDGALALTEVIGDATKRIFLGHLSKDNNMKELAHLTADNILREKELGVDEVFTINDTDPDAPTALFSL